MQKMTSTERNAQRKSRNAEKKEMNRSIEAARILNRKGPEARLKNLDDRLGTGVGAKRERAKIAGELVRKKKKPE